MFDKRINIFTGHFGSGKTEVAVNYAFALSERYDRVAIVDLDIVNPFFRTADARQELEGRGIKTVLPLFANTNVDVPALSPEINMLFEKKEYRVVLDVGGDDLGAKAVSRYKDEIIADDYELLFVVNTRRPMTDTPGKIAEMICEIEGSSRIAVTGLVNNTNLLGSTTCDDILKGHEMVCEISDKLGIPVKFISGLDSAVSGLKGKTGIEVLVMHKYIRLPWE